MWKTKAGFAGSSLRAGKFRFSSLSRVSSYKSHGSILDIEANGTLGFYDESDIDLFMKSETQGIGIYMAREV